MNVSPGEIVRTERGCLRVTSEVKGRSAKEAEGYYGVLVTEQHGKYVDRTRTTIFVPAREVIEVLYPVYRRIKWHP